QYCVLHPSPTLRSSDLTTPWTISSIPKRVYAMGNFSRFMRPGSTLLTSTSTSTSLESTAALPTTGKLALVLSNTSSGSITVTVKIGRDTSELQSPDQPV